VFFLVFRIDFGSNFITVTDILRPHQHLLNKPYFMKKTILLLLPFCLLGCEKKVSNISGLATLINQAQTFFSDSVANRGQPLNYRASQARSVQWDLAQVLPMKNGQGVLAPIVYPEPMMIKSNFSGGFYFHLNYLTQLLVYKDADSAEKAVVITSFPDSNFFKNPLGKFTGIKFIEDWRGRPVSKLLYGADGTIKKYVAMTKEVTDVEVITTCYTISGYNYSPADPDDGYSWTESAGCSVSYFEAGDGSGGESVGAPSFGGGGGGSTAATVVIATGHSVIQSVPNYFQCFTNVGGTDHTYTAAVCVDEPVPGSRTPWGLTPGGPSGSSQAGGAVNAGHTFLILTESYGNTTITRNIGFYPSSIVWPASPTSSGQMNDDETHSYNISGSFTLDNAQFFTILNFISAESTPSFLYNLNTNNCTTFVINAMAQAGIGLPRTVGTWPGGAGDDPGDLGEDMRAGNIPGMSLNTAPGNSHGNVGQCN
jgi:hypothetical protein